jgi:hypothetical protein
MMSVFGKVSDIRGFSKAFKQAFDIRGYATALWSGCNPAEPGRFFISAFTQGAKTYWRIVPLLSLDLREARKGGRNSRGGLPSFHWP